MLAAKRARFKNALAALKAEHEELRSYHAALMVDNHRMKLQFKQLEQERASVEAHLEAIRREHNDLKTAHAKLISELAALQAAQEAKTRLVAMSNKLENSASAGWQQWQQLQQQQRCFASLFEHGSASEAATQEGAFSVGHAAHAAAVLENTVYFSFGGGLMPCASRRR